MAAFQVEKSSIDHYIIEVIRINNLFPVVFKLCKEGDGMKITHTPLQKAFKIFMVIIIGVSFFISCEKSIYAAFFIPERARNLMDVRDSVEVHFRLIPSSLFENELHIVNNSGSTVYINPKEIFFAVNGRDIKVPIEEDYDAYLMKVNSKATLLCNRSDTSYKCVDAISAITRKFKGKGFDFLSIKPGNDRRGYIAFKFPTPLNDSPVNEALTTEFYRNNKTLRGAINIELIIGERIANIAFPLEIRLYDNIRKSPFELPVEIK